MNGEKCTFCFKAMGNSMSVDKLGKPAHSKCQANYKDILIADRLKLIDYDFSEIREDIEDVIKIAEALMSRGFDEWAGKFHKRGCDCAMCGGFKQGLGDLIKILKKETTQSHGSCHLGGKDAS